MHALDNVSQLRLNRIPVSRVESPSLLILVDDFDPGMIFVWVHDSTVIDIDDRISSLACYRLEGNATILS